MALHPSLLSVLKVMCRTLLLPPRSLLHGLSLPLVNLRILLHQLLVRQWNHLLQPHSSLVVRPHKSHRRPKRKARGRARGRARCQAREHLRRTPTLQQVARGPAKERLLLRLTPPRGRKARVKAFLERPRHGAQERLRR